MISGKGYSGLKMNVVYTNVLNCCCCLSRNVSCGTSVSISSCSEILFEIVGTLRVYTVESPIADTLGPANFGVILLLNRLSSFRDKIVLS